MKFPYQLATFLALVALAGLTAPRLSGADRLERFEFDEPHMGLRFRIVLYSQDQQTAREAASAAFERIETLNQKLSDYEPESELNRLSQSAGKGEPVPVSDDLWNVLTHAQKLAERSQADRVMEARVMGYEGEACGECGNFTLVRNGTCLKCDTCGGTSGCS
jgi:thiamine biosynthesis lipoprotein ApbE